MFKQLFATMNEVLDEISTEYPQATGERKQQLDEQLNVLKSMSDTCVEEWLLFEEKMGHLYAGQTPHAMEAKAVKQPCAQAAFSTPESGKAVGQDDFQIGQGYYKLGMFDKAAESFERIIQQQPELLLARAYLAMCLLRTQRFGDAYRHFQLLLPLTENTTMKAISYNAMGCIQAEQRNYEKACEYFLKAYRADPTCVDPVLKTVTWPRFQ